MNRKKIWLSLAQMCGREIDFVHDAFDSNWVVPLGPNVDGFENDLKEYLFSKDEQGYVVALSSGTAAIHLALLQLGVLQGDDVICQTFTFAASANAICYLKATPVFVDSESESWNMDPELLEEAILNRFELTGKYPKAVLSVNLYGMPAKLDELMAVCNKYNIPLLEDAAEALGAKYKGKPCGTFGHFGVISFNGNKILTTSGGGVLICKKAEEAKKTLFYATQAREDAVHYEHKEVGYNYRLSNVCAGIGRGQMTAIEYFLKRRRENQSIYTELLSNLHGIYVQQNPGDDFDSNFWLTTIIVDADVFGASSDEIRIKLQANNIESRPLWKPMHLQSAFDHYPAFVNGISEHLFHNGLCLPSGAAVTFEDIVWITDIIKSFQMKK